MPPISKRRSHSLKANIDNYDESSDDSNFSIEINDDDEAAANYYNFQEEIELVT